MLHRPGRTRPTSPSAHSGRLALLHRSAPAFLAVATTALLAATPASARPRGMGGKPPTEAAAAATLPPTADPGVPAMIDLRQWAVPVGDQGELNSCTAWTVGHGLMGWWAKKAGIAETDFAPMYMYSQINGGKDEGAYADDALELGATQGIDTVAHYAHPANDFLTQPTALERGNAAVFKIGGYKTLFAGDKQGDAAKVAIQNSLTAGSPVAIEFPVRPGFDSLPSVAAGTTPPLDDDTTGVIRGWHEVLAVGYDAQGVIVQNSWGSGFGSGGYARLSWSVVTKDVIDAAVATGWGQKAAPVLNKLGAIADQTGTVESVLGNVSLFDASSATVRYDWGKTEAYGQSATSTISHTPGSGTNAFGRNLTGLTPGTVYHYKVTFTTTGGTITSGDRTFVTASAPKINSFGAIPLTGSTTSVLGNVSGYAAGASTVKVDYGTTTSYGSTASQDLNMTGNGSNAFGLRLEKLRPGVVYHYRITITSRYGSTATNDATFTTLTAPVINSYGAISQGPNVEAVLGNVDISTASTGTVSYEWGTTTAYGNTATTTVAHTPGAGTNAFGTSLRGLTGGTIYHYKITVTTANGTVTTGDQQFVTQAPPKINSSGAILRSQGADILGNISLFTAASGTVKLSYGPTSAYGTTMTQTVNHTGVGSNAFGFNVRGLTPGVTYHWAITLQTEFGTVTSADQTFVATA